MENYPHRIRLRAFLITYFVENYALPLARLDDLDVAPLPSTSRPLSSRHERSFRAGERPFFPHPCKYRFQGWGKKANLRLAKLLTHSPPL